MIRYLIYFIVAFVGGYLAVEFLECIKKAKETKINCHMCNKVIKFEDSEEYFFKADEQATSMLIRVCEDCAWYIDEGNGR